MLNQEFAYKFSRVLVIGMFAALNLLIISLYFYASSQSTPEFVAMLMGLFSLDTIAHAFMNTITGK